MYKYIFDKSSLCTGVYIDIVYRHTILLQSGRNAIDSLKALSLIHIL